MKLINEKWMNEVAGLTLLQQKFALYNWPAAWAEWLNTCLTIPRDKVRIRRHDTQHNDIQHNDIQHNDIQHNDIQHKGQIA